MKQTISCDTAHLFLRFRGGVLERGSVWELCRGSDAPDGASEGVSDADEWTGSDRVTLDGLTEVVYVIMETAGGFQWFMCEQATLAHLKATDKATFKAWTAAKGYNKRQAKGLRADLTAVRAEIQRRLKLWETKARAIIDNEA